MYSVEQIRKCFRTINDYPKKGVKFVDIVPMMENGDAFGSCISLMAKKVEKDVDKIVGIESRGFIIGAALANQLNMGFSIIRKRGKLPYKVIAEEYRSEYGTGVLEMHEDSVSRGENIVIVDDVLATGGTAQAACRLVERLGGKINCLLYLAEIEKMDGRKALQDYHIESLIKI